jgi:hypothetical protein
LHIPQRDSGILGGGDESMTTGVRAYDLGDSRLARHAADDPGGAAPVQPPPARVRKTGPSARFADRQVDRPGGARGERDGDHLAPLRVTTRVRCPRSIPRFLDVGANSLGDPQPVERQQGNQRVLGRRAEPGLQVAGEALNVGPPGLEEVEVMLLASGRLLAQVQGVRLAREAGVTGQEPSQCQPLGVGEYQLSDGDHGRWGRRGSGHRAPPGSG